MSGETTLDWSVVEPRGSARTFPYELGVYVPLIAGAAAIDPLLGTVIGEPVVGVPGGRQFSVGHHPVDRP